ncbi:hypothetical protein chiPu_0014369 [Chiloscyllium punctatum]|uniref:Uncharacterized protein n=1 Tax=Chiloscyllium punctatum TaxID=137246 RepID=A0A401SZS1_CHIPU|nr:hypothetical protein [Chiloscyllium punctatum]
MFPRHLADCRLDTGPSAVLDCALCGLQIELFTIWGRGIGTARRQQIGPDVAWRLGLASSGDWALCSPECGPATFWRLSQCGLETEPKLAWRRGLLQSGDSSQCTVKSGRGAALRLGPVRPEDRAWCRQTGPGAVWRLDRVK